MRIQVNKGIFSLLIALLVFLHANAQDRGKRTNTIQPQPKALNVPGLKTGKNLALIIGTDKFQDAYW
ncbi:MAG: hypothetical protein K8F30_00360, partial [Taibaiella sp.]|nr:hypothetical protein [Taibaiella sp.]